MVQVPPPVDDMYILPVLSTDGLVLFATCTYKVAAKYCPVLSIAIEYHPPNGADVRVQVLPPIPFKLFLILSLILK